MRRLNLIPVPALAALLAACGGATSATPTSSSSAPATTPATTAAPVESASTTPVAEAPQKFVAKQGETSTWVGALDADRNVTAERTIPGRWEIPVITTDGRLDGVSPNGKTLVLVGVNEPSKFAILDGSLTEEPVIRSLPERFSFDTVSDDGSRLIVIENLNDAGKYQVRSYNVARERLDEQVLAEKEDFGTNGPLPMQGFAISRTVASNMVLTLYKSKDHMFVHALDPNQEYIVDCLDLSKDLGTEGTWSIGTIDGKPAVVEASRGVAVPIVMPSQVPNAGWPDVGAQFSVTPSDRILRDAAGALLGSNGQPLARVA